MRARIIIAICISFGLVACDQAITPTIASIGGQTGSGGDTATITLTVSPGSPTIVVGGTAQLTTSAASDLLPLRWATSDATVATVSSAGIVTAIGAGTAVITATSTKDTLASGTALVTVTSQ